MSNKEAYLSPNTPQSVINEKVYTDYAAFCSHSGLSAHFIDSTPNYTKEAEKLLKPPF